MQAVPFRASPSLFYLFPKTTLLRVPGSEWHFQCSRSPLPQQMGGVASAGVWAALWMLYLSFVNVGQTFYSFGWETLLCEVGFVTIFAGASRMEPNMWLNWIWRWTLFRLMFGAGLIKLRGDPCWRDLTCLN